jgi:phospholipase D1/2
MLGRLTHRKVTPSVPFRSHSFLISLSPEALSDMAYHAPGDLRNDLFHLLWRDRSDRNSAIYDWLDGEDVSIYRCRNLAQLKNGLLNFAHKASEGPLVKEKLSEIQGTLINFPLRFLEDDDLSPPLSLRPLAASNLWL